jgi:hypothetical protein
MIFYTIAILDEHRLSASRCEISNQIFKEIVCLKKVFKSIIRSLIAGYQLFNRNHIWDTFQSHH